MVEQIKFTDEEIAEINKLREEFTQIFIQLGQINLERKSKVDELNALETQLVESHSKLVEREETIFKSLNEKYGDGDYDPNTGIFTPITKN